MAFRFRSAVWIGKPYNTKCLYILFDVSVTCPENLSIPKSQLHWFKSSCISFVAIVSKLWRLQLRGAICKNSGSKREAYCIHGEKRIWITFQFKIVDLGQILGLLCNSVLKELPGRVLQKFVSQNKLATLYTNQWLRLISMKLLFLTPPFIGLKWY